MKNFDITLYGHLSYDNIYEDINYKSSIGCIGNVWNQLKLINPNIKVKIEPTDIGESLIVVDVQQCKRTSISHLSLKTRTPHIHSSTINHIMYLNEISNKEFISLLSGFNVADICNGKRLDINDPSLEHIDLLLVSDEDVQHLSMLYLCCKVRGCVLMHSSNGSTLYYKTNETHFNAELVPNINVLGAGDKFAAYILAGLLDSTKDLPKVIQDAHNELTNYFKNEKV
jgi:hypothetical protein